MLVFGLGLTESHWKFIFQRIQKPLTQKMKARLLAQSEIQPQSIIATCEDISKSPPALFLLTPQGFSAFTDCLFFLSQLQMRISEKQTQYGLILENIEKDLHPFITYQPKITLVNQMQFTVADPSLLVQQPIQRFPRIRIPAETLRLEYQNLNNTMVNHSLEEIPTNQLIPFNQIQTIFTESGAQSPEAWLPNFLNQQGKPQVAPQVKGILKENQGGYLFPGLPIDRIQTMSLGDIHLHFILSYQQLSQRSLAFKRMIEDLTHHRQSQARKGKTSKESMPPVRCLGNIQIINQLVGMLLSKMGMARVRFIQHLPPGTHALEDSLLWLQLNGFEEVVLEGKFLNLQEKIQQILQPLAFFVEIEQLKILPQFPKAVISRLEMEAQRDRLMKQEKQRANEYQLAQNKHLLFSQEEEVLGEATQIAQRLMRALAKSLPWDEVMAMKSPLPAPQVLFFCEEQEQAYELNQQMAHVSKKLWISPNDYQNADQFRHLNIEMIQQYAQHGIIITTPEAMKHWESLNNQIFDRFQEITQESVLQTKTMQQAQAELDLIQQQKESLALQWLYQSLQQLLKDYRSAFFPAPEKP